jgi:hypothetical protein
VNAVSKPLKSSGIQLGVVVTQITGLVNFLKKEKYLLHAKIAAVVEITRVIEAGPKFG